MDEKERLEKLNFLKKRLKRLFVEDDRGKAKLFSKSFKHNSKKKDGVISVVVDIDGENVSISTHPKHLKRVIDGIKNAADLVYEKPNSGLTAGNNPKNPTITGTTQLPNNISQTSLNVNDKNKSKE